MTDQLRNSKDQPSTDAEENPILEMQVAENSTKIDVPYPNKNNDEILVRELVKILMKPSLNGNTTLPEQNLISLRGNHLRR